MTSIEKSKQDHEETDAQYWIIKCIATKLDPSGQGDVKGFWKDRKYIILFGEDMVKGRAYYGDSQIAAVQAVLRGLQDDKETKSDREAVGETQTTDGSKGSETKDS